MSRDLCPCCADVVFWAPVRWDMAQCPTGCITRRLRVLTSPWKPRSQEGYLRKMFGSRSLTYFYLSLFCSIIYFLLSLLSLLRLFCPTSVFFLVFLYLILFHSFMSFCLSSFIFLSFHLYSLLFPFSSCHVFMYSPLLVFCLSFVFFFFKFSFPLFLSFFLSFLSSPSSSYCLFLSWILFYSLPQH